MSTCNLPLNPEVWGVPRSDIKTHYKEVLMSEALCTLNTKAKLRILLVDDEQVCLEIGSIYLKRMGYEVVTVNGGIPALEYLKAHPGEIHLILLDLMMPDMYGLDVLKALRADPTLKNIPVIMQSGFVNHEDISTAELILGAIKPSISKPYTKTDIEKAINNATVKTHICDASEAEKAS